MLTIYILISVFAFIAALSAIINARKKRERAMRKWKEFEKRNPSSSVKKDKSKQNSISESLRIAYLKNIELLYGILKLNSSQIKLQSL